MILAILLPAITINSFKVIFFEGLFRLRANNLKHFPIGTLNVNTLGRCDY
jgi:hypothetical protein